MDVQLSSIEEAYLKAIEPLRRLALSLAPLSISLASASLAFEIYYLREIYDPKTAGLPGLFNADFGVLTATDGLVKKGIPSTAFV